MAGTGQRGRKRSWAIPRSHILQTRRGGGRFDMGRGGKVENCRLLPRQVTNLPPQKTASGDRKLLSTDLMLQTVPSPARQTVLTSVRRPVLLLSGGCPAFSGPRAAARRRAGRAIVLASLPTLVRQSLSTPGQTQGRRALRPGRGG